MGKKIDIKKIENLTKRQVTFSKRRSSLIKKSHEISVMCDVDVLFLAFSPSGRLTKFCSRNRIEDMLERYIDLPAEKRHQHPMKNVEEKLEKLKMYDRVVKGDENKLQFLNNQINHMELQMKKSSVELELFEVNLRDYEPDPSLDPSLAQLLWCEKNLKRSLHRLNDKKRMLFNLPTFNDQVRVQKERIQRHVSFNNGGNDQLNWVSRNLNSSQLRSQLNPWISPNYRSSKVGETTIVEELIIGDQIINGGNGALGVADNYMCNNNNQLRPIIGDQSLIQQSGMPILLAPQPSVSTTYTTTYPQMLQHQEGTAEEWNFVHPNQQLGVLPSSSPLPTDHTSNQNMNMNMNMNANLPMRSTISQLECEDFLNPNYIESNTNEKQHAPPDPTLIITNSIPPSAPDVELLLPDNCNNSPEDLMGNDDKITSSVAGNQEDRDYSFEWDGFVLAENLINLDDLDIF